MEKRVLLVYNIHSGKGAIKAKLAELIDAFGREKCKILVASTQGPGDAKKTIVEHAETTDLVVACGGDGTVNEAVSGILESGKDIPFLFIPTGSTNDYAATLQIPKEPLAAIDRFLNGQEFAVDIGRFNGRYFNYTASFGLLTDISYTTDQNLKNTLGYAAYILEVPKRLFRIPVLRMTVETAEGLTFTDGWFYGMVTNATQVGGLKNVTGPNVLLDDGLFEVTLIRATTNPIEFLEVFNAVTTGGESRFVERFKTSKAVFHFEEEVTWTVDGEPGGGHREVVIENLPRAMKIIVPKMEKTDWEEDDGE